MRREEAIRRAYSRVLSMVKRKRRSGEWHHRVPDFKLVYCGPRKNAFKEETKDFRLYNVAKIPVTAEGDGAEVRKSKK